MPSCILHPSQEATKNGACKNRQDRDTSQQPSPLLDPGVCAVRIPSCECTVGSLAPVPVSCSPLHPAALFLGSRNCLPQRGVSHAHPHLRSRSPALSWGADGPGWDEHRPLPSSARFAVEETPPFPQMGSGFVSGAEGPEHGLLPALLPNVRSLFYASSHLLLCFPLRPPSPTRLPPSFQMEKPAPLVLLRCRKLPRGESRSRLTPPPLNGFQHAVARRPACLPQRPESRRGLGGRDRGQWTGE